MNAVCPGWVATELSAQSGPKSPAEGADTPVWTALLHPREKVTGQYFQERLHFPW